MIRFEVKGRPVPWKRLRRKGNAYFPAAGQVEAKDAVREAFAEAAPSGFTAPSDRAVEVIIHAVFALPMRPDRRRAGDPHIMKPDGDNIAKLVKDALSGLAYKDDCQVSRTVVKKQWSDHDRTSVTVEYMDPYRGRAS